MGFYRYLEKPRCSFAVKVLIVIFCALCIAYMTAGPSSHPKGTLTTSRQPPEHLTSLSPQLDNIEPIYVEVGITTEDRENISESADVSDELSAKWEGRFQFDNSDPGENALNSRMEYNSPWTYSCVKGTCQRKLFSEVELEKGAKTNKEGQGSRKVPLAVCWLNCGKYGALWPIPTNSESLAGKPVIPFHLTNLHFSLDNVKNVQMKSFVNETVILTSNILQQMDTSGSRGDVTESDPDNSIEVSITLPSSESEDNSIFRLDSTDESYKLEISETNDGNIKVSIEAKTNFGIRHALETLTQLIAYDEINKFYQIIGNVKIEDKPSFEYRGVLIDVSRNFIPVPKLQKIVDGLSYNKLNILHLHLSDYESFTVFNEKSPEMSICESYSKQKMYSAKELKDLVSYARIRGIKIIPEFDPNHLHFGDIPPLDATSCVTKRKGNNGLVSSTNLFHPDVLPAIGEFYKTVLDIFDKDVIHFGSFDLSFDTKCLKSKNGSGEVFEWMKKENLTDHSQIRTSFLNKVSEKIREVNNGEAVQGIIFGADLTVDELKSVNYSNYVIQIWGNARNSRVKSLAKENYRIVISDTSLNNGFNGANHEYTLWQSLYDESIPSDVPPSQILGSEVMVWTQNTNGGSIEAKLWPRASAMAERLWSNPKVREKDVYSRLNNHNFRMLSRGLKTESLQPESCYQISGNCDDTRHSI